MVVDREVAQRVGEHGGCRQRQQQDSGDERTQDPGSGPMTPCHRRPSSVCCARSRAAGSRAAPRAERGARGRPAPRPFFHGCQITQRDARESGRPACRRRGRPASAGRRGGIASVDQRRGERVVAVDVGTDGELVAGEADRPHRIQPVVRQVDDSRRSYTEPASPASEAIASIVARSAATASASPAPARRSRRSDRRASQSGRNRGDRRVEARDRVIEPALRRVQAGETDECRRPAGRTSSAAMNAARAPAASPVAIRVSPSVAWKNARAPPSSPSSMAASTAATSAATALATSPRTKASRPSRTARRCPHRSVAAPGRRPRRQRDRRPPAMHRP